MRPSSNKRSRHKSGGSSHQNRRNVGNIINRVFDSAGPEGKVRGTPQQIIDKYQALARDAQLSGDRVAAESFLQHSEHYSRMLGEAQRQQAEARQQQQEREEASRPDTRSSGAPENAPAQVQETSREAQGLTTIDAGSEQPAGPIETPEGRVEARPRPMEVVETKAPEAAEPKPAEVNGTEHAAAAGDGEATPRRSTRGRRRTKPAETPADADAAVASPAADQA